MSLTLLLGLGLAVSLIPAPRSRSGEGRQEGAEELAIMQATAQHLIPARARFSPALRPSQQRVQQFPALPSVRQFQQPARVPRSVKPVAATSLNAATEAAVSSSAEKAAVMSALEAGEDAAVRSDLATKLPALEASNPTSNPAYSDLLSGKWIVKYTGSVAKGPIDSPTREIALLMYAAGFGPGNAALSVANRLPDNLVEVKMLSLDISRLPGESRATLALRLLNGQTDSDVELVCDLAADGPAKLIETGKEVILNKQAPVEIPSQLRYTRDLFVTYLDSELMIARDATGSPDILVRDTSAVWEPVIQPEVIVETTAPDSV